MKIRRGGSFSSGMIVMYHSASPSVTSVSNQRRITKPGEAPGKYSPDQNICNTDSGFNPKKKILENQHRRRGELSSVVHQQLGDIPLRVARDHTDVKLPPLAVNFGIFGVISE